MTVIPIGELSHRLRLERPVRTPEAGGAVVTWVLVAELWGAIRPTGGGEVAAGDRLEERAASEIWVRYRDGVTAAMRFVLGRRVFDIRAVIESGERKRYLRCLVEERKP
jgi:SPP1 family predicted phage head-tail adaptor